MTITSTTIITALTLMGLGVLFVMGWNVILMLDNKQTNEKLDNVAKDLWDTMACKVNHTEYDAKEFIDLNHRDTLYTADYYMRQDFEKSVRNITNLAYNLGYTWKITDDKGNNVPGYWAKVKPTNKLFANSKKKVSHHTV